MNENNYWLPADTVVGQRYKIEKVLGIGGYGITYRGLDTRLQKTVAIKEYYPGFWAIRNIAKGYHVEPIIEYLADYDKGIERFLDEAKTLVSLSDIPEIVRVSDFFEENQTAYLVMDYLDGKNLKQMLEGFNGRIPPDILIPVMEPIIKALGKVHQKGMIHRDLSPDNIMMLENGTTRLIDFGNARDASNNKSMTMAMKEGFAAPEQYRSKGQGTYTDVYGICATMYYCLTGKLPPQAMDRLMGAAFPTPIELGVEILPNWQSAIMDGLELYVQKRIQTMEELWQRIYGASETVHISSMIQREPEKIRSVIPQEPETENSKLLKEWGIYLDEIPSKDAGEEEYPKTLPGDLLDSQDSADHFEQKIQGGLEKIRDICMGIYRKIKEK